MKTWVKALMRMIVSLMVLSILAICAYAWFSFQHDLISEINKRVDRMRYLEPEIKAFVNCYHGKNFRIPEDRKIHLECRGRGNSTDQPYLECGISSESLRLMCK